MSGANDQQAQKQQKQRKYSRLNHSPITVSGTPDDQGTKQFQQARFPISDFSHRNQAYHQPLLRNRLSIDDLLSEEWDKGLREKVLSHRTTLTENDFDFSDDGFPRELFRVGGTAMVNDYETQHANDQQLPKEDQQESPNSIRIYEKVAACYRPEMGESNAESAERHRHIAQRVMELKRTRIGHKSPTTEYPTRLSTRFPTAQKTTRLINIKQHRATKRRLDLNTTHKEGSSTNTDTQQDPPSKRHDFQQPKQQQDLLLLRAPLVDLQCTYP